MRNSHSRSTGFSLIEIAIVVVIVVIIAALMAPLLAGFVNVDRSIKAYDDVRRAYVGIVGNPNLGNFGYLGDVGTYPSSLMDLVRDPGVTGWNGPYLTGVSVENDMVLDSFGLPMEYFYSGSSTAVTDLIGIISKGPDHGSTNTSNTPNVFSTYAGTPLPSSALYTSAGANPDNIVYPRFTDNIGLLSYQNAGQINLNVQNYDYNSNVAAYGPACPNLYAVKVTSASRSSDTFAASYTSSGGSFDLIQGIYRVQLYNSTSGGVFWDQTLTVGPGTSQNHTVNAPGVNSAATQIYGLLVSNSFGTTVSVYGSAGTVIGAVTNATTGSFSVRGCSQVTIRHFSNGGVVDAFLMPVDLSTYTRVLYPIGSASVFNYTVINSTGAYRHLLVYINNLLVGQVSGLGNRKSKVFRSLKSGESLVIRNQAGAIVLPSSNLTSSGTAGL